MTEVERMNEGEKLKRDREERIESAKRCVVQVLKIVCLISFFCLLKNEMNCQFGGQKEEGKKKK